MKDTKGHGSNGRGADAGGSRYKFFPAHQYGVQRMGTGSEVIEKAGRSTGYAPQKVAGFGNRTVSERVADRLRTDAGRPFGGGTKFRTPNGRADSLRRVRFLGDAPTAR
jgi:hypothetical protein